MKQENRGMSLIEVIVAITILAVCAVPLFRSMVLSAQVNAKSRLLLSATNTAEAVLENMKSEGMEEFIQENQRNTDIAEVKYLDKNNKSAGYSFVYPAYKMDKQEFRVQVEVRPYANPDHDKDYNKEEVSNIYRMNRTTDAIFTEDTGLVKEDYLKAVTKGEYKVDEEDTVMRDLEVEYDYQILSEKGKQQVKQTVTYLYKGNRLGEHLTQLYDSDEAGGTLYNLYIFFEPKKKNVITIHNTSDYPVMVYLIKQGEKPSNLTVDIRGTTLMQNLGEEKDPDYTKGVRLRTNLKDGSDHVSYSYMQKNVKEDKLKPADLEKYFDMNSLDGSKQTYRLYDVTVQVMKDRKEITELTGTVTR